MIPQRLYPIRLIDYQACSDCRFANITDQPSPSGGIQRVIRCSRRDCDNWVFEDENDGMQQLLKKLLEP